MPKKLMIDESHRLPKYDRVVVLYKCGCSYYNDGWKSSCESGPTCPTHDQPIKAETVEFVLGIRPEKSETFRHTYKID